MPLGYRGIRWHNTTMIYRYTLAQCHYDIEVCMGIVPLEIFLQAGIGRVPLSEWISRHRESLTMLKVKDMPLRKNRVHGGYWTTATPLHPYTIKDGYTTS